MSAVWIINGMPGSGKSTLARALAARWPRAVHIEGDRLQQLIVTGSVPPGAQPIEEERRQIHLNVRNQCLLARSFAADHFVPVLDYIVVNRARIDEYRDHLRGLDLHLITLAPPLTVALQRDRDRMEKTVAAAWMHLDAQIRSELQGVGLWVDNADLTVERCVDLVLSKHQAARI